MGDAVAGAVVGLAVLGAAVVGDTPGVPGATPSAGEAVLAVVELAVLGNSLIVKMNISISKNLINLLSKSFIR